MRSPKVRPEPQWLTSIAIVAQRGLAGLTGSADPAWPVGPVLSLGRSCMPRARMGGRASVRGWDVARGERHQVRVSPVAVTTESDPRRNGRDDRAPVRDDGSARGENVGERRSAADCERLASSRPALGSTCQMHFGKRPPQANPHTAKYGMLPNTAPRRSSKRANYQGGAASRQPPAAVEGVEVKKPASWKARLWSFAPRTGG